MISDNSSNVNHEGSSIQVKLEKPLEKPLYGQITNLSPYSGAFNYVVLMVGTSLVATSYSFSLTTPVFGLFTELLLGIWCWFSALALFNASCIVGATSGIDLGRKVFGTNFWGHSLTFIFLSFPFFSVLIGALAAYLTISSNAVKEYVSIDPVVIQIFFACLFALLGSINSFENTKFISFFTFAVFLVIVGVTDFSSIYLLTQIDKIPDRPFNFGRYVQSIPVLVFGLNGHMTLPGMAGEMTKASQKKFPVFLLIGQLIVVGFNSSVGFLPSYLFGECTQNDSVLHLSCIFYELYNSRNIFIVFAQMCLGIALIIQAPLLVLPMKELILDKNGKTVRDYSIFVNVISSVVLAAIAGVLGILLGNITDILNTVAAVGGLILLGPAAAILSYKTEKSIFSRVRATFLMVFGCAFVIINIYTIIVSFTDASSSTADPSCQCSQA